VWGLGLNGNPISDLGVGTLARALAGRASLRDIGITLSDVTDVVTSVTSPRTVSVCPGVALTMAPRAGEVMTMTGGAPCQGLTSARCRTAPARRGLRRSARSACR
jgi:hypothetical protein